MEKYLNQKVYILTILGGYNGGATSYKGVLTSYDEDYIYLDNNVCITRKYILSIELK